MAKLGGPSIYNTTEKILDILTSNLAQLDNGYKHLIISKYNSAVVCASEPAKTGYHVYCGICKASNIVDVNPWDYTNSYEILDILWEKIKYIAQQHKHYEYSDKLVINSFGELEIYISKKSYNIKTWIAPPIYEGTEKQTSTQIGLMCSICCKSTHFYLKNGQLINDILPEVNEFLYAHEHNIKEYQAPTVAENWKPEKIEIIKNKDKENYYYKHSYEKQELQKLPTIIKPYTLPPKITDSISTTFKSSVSPNLNVVLKPEIMKEVYRLSNFNVDLQCKTSFGQNRYRALCSSCQAELKIDNFIELSAFNRNSQTWISLTAFCTEHTHIVTIDIEIPLVGRKFKDI